MKSRQVGLVLIALIAIGLAGLVVRLVSAGQDELVLSGILPITENVVDRVVITAGDQQAELRKVGETWMVGNNVAFPPRLEQFWSAVAEIDGAQLIAANPANHQRMGVGDGQGATVQFYLGPSLQEQFITGKWSPDAGLCYLRRPARNEVYGIHCPTGNVFDPNADRWRNPVAASVPRQVIESVRLTLAGDEFMVTLRESGWTVQSGLEERPASQAQVDLLLRALEGLVARSFATEAEIRGLNFDQPTASVHVTTRSDSGFPSVGLDFIKRDDISYYVRNSTEATVFILDAVVVDSFLRPRANYLAEQTG